MASTYTVNIGIEKPGTGDQSGTWGTTTNTNFDIIDQATNGVATVTLAAAGTSGSPNTLLINNGALSDGRNRFIEFNDGADLGATAYVQLDPNDAEKIVHIRNSLSASRSLILFQGTYNASNDFEVPNGADVLVKFDGGGAGATVTDVNVNLTPTKVTTGDLDVDNININGNTIISTDTNGDINISPDGTGTVVINTDLDVDNININGNTIISTDTNGNIALTPNGTGEVDISKVDIDSGAIDGTVIGASSAAAITGTTITGTSATVTGDLTVDTNTLYVDSTNNRVGIGTTSPASIAHIKTAGTTGTNLLSLENGSNKYDFRMSGNDLYIRDGADDRITLTSGGNVGIGTTSPGAKIDINSSTEGDIYFRGGTGATRQLKLSTFATASNHAGHDFDIGSGNGVFSFSINGSEAMRIDSSGNVGIGTSSPDADLHIAASNQSTSSRGNLYIATTDAYAADKGGQITFGGRYFDSPADTFFGSIAGRKENANVSNVQGYLSFATRATAGHAERMRIDSSGNVGIGTSSPSKTLHVSSGAYSYPARITQTGGTTVGLEFTNTGSGANPPVVGSKSDDIFFETNNAERMRIDSSGNLLVGTTGVNAAGVISVDFDGQSKQGITLDDTYASTGGYYIYFRNSANAQAGAIIHNGSTTVNYSTSSDYRLKTAVNYEWDATTRLKQLKPARFAWISDGDNAVPVDGFLAHEVQDIVPEAITGTKDAMMDEEYTVSAATGDIYTPAIEAVIDEDGNEVTPAVAEVIHSTNVERPEELAEGQQWRETTAAVMGTRSVPDYQGIDQSKLVPLLVKTIQELEARIAALEAN